MIMNTNGGCIIHCTDAWVCMYDDMAQEAQISKKKKATFALKSQETI